MYKWVVACLRPFLDPVLKKIFGKRYTCSEKTKDNKFCFFHKYSEKVQSHMGLPRRVYTVRDTHRASFLQWISLILWIKIIFMMDPLVFTFVPYG